MPAMGIYLQKLFRISKISTFESNSQLLIISGCKTKGCSEYQRYQPLRAIHNSSVSYTTVSPLFRISKISTFESNSQPKRLEGLRSGGCSEYQRYQPLRAIHNITGNSLRIELLFRISKISTFESNSQLHRSCKWEGLCCSEYQRYQPLRAIHNKTHTINEVRVVVPNIKDINL